MQDVVAGIVIRNGRVLLAQRLLTDKGLPGKWEFPGGKIEMGEDPEAALVRELQEELKITVEVGRFFAATSHKDKFRILAYLAKIQEGNPTRRVHADLRWVDPEDLSNFDLAPADIPIAHKLLHNWPG